MNTWQMRINTNGVINFSYKEDPKSVSTQCQNVPQENDESVEVFKAAKYMCIALNIKDETVIRGREKKVTINCIRPYIDAYISTDEKGKINLKVNISVAMTKEQYDAFFDFGDTLKEHGWIS